MAKKPKKPQLNIQLEPDERDAFDEIKRLTGVEDKVIIRGFMASLFRAFEEQKKLVFPIELRTEAESKAANLREIVQSNEPKKPAWGVTVTGKSDSKKADTNPPMKQKAK